MLYIKLAQTDIFALKMCTLQLRVGHTSIQWWYVDKLITALGERLRNALENERMVNV